MMRKIKRLCVYCGSASGIGETYREAARELGRRMAAAGIELVYGGGRIGLMGVIADAVLAGGGRVVGVIPARLRDAEVAHHGASELIVVETMHDRKRVMAEQSDAFAVLPGGVGTLDETFEIMTWRQLGLHDKPVYLVDVGGYWRPLLALFDHVVASGFSRGLAGVLIERVSGVAALMDMVDPPP